MYHRIAFSSSLVQLWIHFFLVTLFPFILQIIHSKCVESYKITSNEICIRNFSNEVYEHTEASVAKAIWQFSRQLIGRNFRGTHNSIYYVFFGFFLSLLSTKANKNHTFACYIMFVHSTPVIHSVARPHAKHFDSSE